MSPSTNMPTLPSSSTSQELFCYRRTSVSTILKSEASHIEDIHNQCADLLESLEYVRIHFLILLRIRRVVESLATEFLLDFVKPYVIKLSTMVRDSYVQLQ